MGMKEKARDLMEEVRSTKEFAELKQAKSVIDKNKALKSQVEEFNKQQMLLYSGKLSAKEAEAKVAELNKKFGDISKIPEVDRFLKASKQFNEVMSKVYKSMNDSIDAELKL